MIYATNVISLQKFRRDKRIHTIKKIALSPVGIYFLCIALVGGITYQLFSLMILQNPDVFSYLNYMP